MAFPRVVCLEWTGDSKAVGLLDWAGKDTAVTRGATTELRKPGQGQRRVINSEVPAEWLTGMGPEHSWRSCLWLFHYNKSEGHKDGWRFQLICRWGKGNLQILLSDGHCLHWLGKSLVVCTQMCDMCHCPKVAVTNRVCRAGFLWLFPSSAPVTENTQSEPTQGFVVVWKYRLKISVKSPFL